MKCLKCGAEFDKKEKSCPFCEENGNSKETSKTKVNTTATKQPVKQFLSAFYSEMKAIYTGVKKEGVRFIFSLGIYEMITVVLLAVFALLFVIATLWGRSSSGIIALMAMIILLTAYAIKKKILITNKHRMFIPLFLLAIFLLIPCCSEMHGDSDGYVWMQELKEDEEPSFSQEEEPTETNSPNKETNPPKTETTSPTEEKITHSIDYVDAASFEAALNNGASVKGMIVQFDVVEYRPDSAWGINCWSGEHLNFISDKELAVQKGDIIIGYITAEPTCSMGSWKIYYTALSTNNVIIDGSDIPAETEPPETEPPETEPPKITVTMSEEELKGLSTAEAEKKLREMGFTIFKYDTLSAGDRSDLDGKIASVEIKTWEFGDGDFSKGDSYEQNAIVVLWSYEYTEPEKPGQVHYSTNDYETAKKGNSGVFSYKNKNGAYDIYWIIDFDEGYVYWFTEGNGDDHCDKVKIVSGTLNDVMEITWNFDGDKTSWYLHLSIRTIRRPWL